MTDFSRVERQERVKWPVLIPGVYVCAYVGIFFKAGGKEDVGYRTAPFSWCHPESQQHNCGLIGLQHVKIERISSGRQVDKLATGRTFRLRISKTG